MSKAKLKTKTKTTEKVKLTLSRDEATALRLLLGGLSYATLSDAISHSKESEYDPAKASALLLDTDTDSLWTSLFGLNLV